MVYPKVLGGKWTCMKTFQLSIDLKRPRASSKSSSHRVNTECLLDFDRKATIVVGLENVKELYYVKGTEKF